MFEIETISKTNARVVETMHRTLRISKKIIIKTLDNDAFIEKPVDDERAASILADLNAPIGEVYLQIPLSSVKDLYATAMRRSNNSRFVRQSFIRYAAKHFE